MIDQITWFRTTLKVHTTDPHENVTFSDGTRTLRFMQEDGWHTLNICYTDNGRFLPEGIWTLSSEDGGAGTETLKSLDVLSRVFAYDKQYAYTVYAEYDLPSEQLRFHTAFMRRDPHPQRRSLKQELFRFGMQCLYTVSAITTRGRDRRVLFLSETRTDMSDNMQHVYDAMLRRGMEKSFHIDFRLRNDLSKGPPPEGLSVPHRPAAPTAACPPCRRQDTVSPPTATRRRPPPSPLTRPPHRPLSRRRQPRPPRPPAESAVRFPQLCFVSAQTPPHMPRQS